MPSRASIRQVADQNGALFDTRPPEERETVSALQRLKKNASAKASALLVPIVKKFSGIGGETIDEAIGVARHLEERGFALTLGYWDTGCETARSVADVYLAAIACLGARTEDWTVSIKPPALRFDAGLAAALAGVAAQRNVRLHLDSHGPNVAEPSNVMLREMCKLSTNLGTTLPGRWRRSLDDAAFAIEYGLHVRIVKGQWPDPDEPDRDMASGFLAVVDRLAGRARHVGVATHDLPLAREAVERLRAAGTPCEIEILLGYPAKPLLRWARQNAVKVRVYVPYGGGFIPNAVAVLKRNPRLLLAVARDRLLRA